MAKNPKRKKPPYIDNDWTPGGRSCIGDHPCPSLTYPNHHDKKCVCTFADLEIHHIDRCGRCDAIVCVGCKGTIL